MKEVRKCDICGMDTTSSLVCNDCMALTRACHKWMNHLKTHKKEDSSRLNSARRTMLNRIEHIQINTLKEWGIL